MDTPTLAEGSSPALETAPAAPATPPAPAAPVAPVAPAAKPTAADILGALNPAERRAYTTGQKSFKDIIAARPPVKGAPAAATPAANTPAPAAPAEPVAPAATPAAPAEGELPDRFRFKETEDQTIAMIAKTKGISLREAARLYDNDPANKPAPAVTPAAPAAPETPAEDPGLKEYDSQLAALDAKLKKLSTDRAKAREDVETEKADSLSDEIADVRAELKLLGHERNGYLRNREASAARTVEQQMTASRDRALAQYADLQTEGSLPRLALDAYVNQALADPKRAAEFRDPTWPEKITAEFAQKHGLKKAGSASAPAAPTPPAPQPVSTLRPKPQQVPGAKLVSGADGSQPSAPAAPTAADLKAALSRMTPAQRRQVMFRRPAAG